MVTSYSLRFVATWSVDYVQGSVAGEYGFESRAELKVFYNYGDIRD